jgi:hypothetical protein
MLLSMQSVLIAMPDRYNNYRANMTTNVIKSCLKIDIYLENAGKADAQRALKAVQTIPAVSNGLMDGSLELAPISLSPTNWLTTGVAKRTIADCRKRQAGETAPPRLVVY